MEHFLDFILDLFSILLGSNTKDLADCIIFNGALLSSVTIKMVQLYSDQDCVMVNFPGAELLYLHGIILLHVVRSSIMRIYFTN